MPCTRWLDDRTPWCAVSVSPLFAKKNPPGSFFTLRPSRVRLPIIQKCKKTATRRSFAFGGGEGSRRELRLCLAPDGSTTAHRGVQYPSHRSSLKRTHRVLFLRSDPLGSDSPLYKNAKDRHTAVFCIWWRRGESNPCPKNLPPDFLRA